MIGYLCLVITLNVAGVIFSVLQFFQLFPSAFDHAHYRIFVLEMNDNRLLFFGLFFSSIIYCLLEFMLSARRDFTISNISILFRISMYSLD